jgi:hypothetical protein
MMVAPGDWVIKEPFPTDDRRFYPCKPEIFEQTYEEVKEERMPCNVGSNDVKKAGCSCGDAIEVVEKQEVGAICRNLWYLDDRLKKAHATLSQLYKVLNPVLKQPADKDVHPVREKPPAETSELLLFVWQLQIDVDQLTDRMASLISLVEV